jgi:tellurite resistance protein TehA-like permease
MGDMIGLLALTALIGLVSLFVPASAVPLLMWLCIYLAWMGSALFIWYHRKAPDRPQAWLVLSLCSVAGVPVWHVISAALISFGGNEHGLAKTFDLIVTLIFSPGLTFIAVTGWIRALAIERLK